MKQIYIENFRVDISRCEVHRENDIFPLEPKVLQVLLFLLKHQGEVVPRQALLDEIWPDSVVEANALQRCIGQLRKAFLDDAKQQRVIATYPKNGYSLLLPVQQKSSQVTTLTRKKTPRGLFPAVGLFILLVIAFFIIKTTQPAADTLPAVSESQNQPLDLYATYSPDDQYVVYTRPDGNHGELKNLWFHDLAKNTEILLTAKPMDNYEAAWSLNSEHLSLVESNQQCSTLKQVSLPLPEKSPTQTLTLIDCQASLLQSPQWISPGHIVLIEVQNDQASIINYDIELARSTIIFQQKNLQPQHLAYSTEANTLAIILIDENFQQQLQLLSLTTGGFTLIDLNVNDTSINEAWYPVWNQQAKGFIISTSKGIFTIGLDGTVSRLNSSFIIE